MGREHHRIIMATAQVTLCVLLLASLPLLISSQNLNYYGHHNRHVPPMSYNVPALTTPLMLSSLLPSYNFHHLQQQPTQPATAYVPHASTVVKETAFPTVSNSVQKLILPIPSNHRLLSTIYNRPIQGEPSSATATAAVVPSESTHQSNQQDAPLHVSHPTLPVPKAYSANPPKYIQVLQFPTVLSLQHQLQQQALQQQLFLHHALQQQQVPMPVTMPMHANTQISHAPYHHTLPQLEPKKIPFTNQQQHREPVSAGSASSTYLHHSLIGNEHKLVTPVPVLQTHNPVKSNTNTNTNTNNGLRQEELAKIIQRVLEASTPRPTPLADIVKSIEVIHLHDNGVGQLHSKPDGGILNGKQQHGISSFIQKPVSFDDIMATGDNSVAGSNTVFKIANLSTPGQSAANNNAEVDVSELIDTFSLSKLEKNTSHNPGQVPSETVIGKLDAMPRNEGSVFRQETRNPMGSHFFDTLEGSSGSLEPDVPAAAAAANVRSAKPQSVGEQLKLRSYMFRDPAFNLIEKYAMSALPLTTTTAPSIVEVFKQKLANTQIRVTDPAAFYPAPANIQWLMVPPVSNMETSTNAASFPTSTTEIRTTSTSTTTLMPSTTTTVMTTTPSTTTTTTPPTTTTTSTAPSTTTTTTTTTTPSTTTTTEPTPITTTTPTTTTTTTTEPTTTSTASTTTTTEPSTTTTTTTPTTTTTIRMTTSPPSTTTPIPTTWAPKPFELPYSALTSSESVETSFPDEQVLLSLLRNSPRFRHATQQLLLQLQEGTISEPATTPPRRKQTPPDYSRLTPYRRSFPKQDANRRHDYFPPNYDTYDNEYSTPSPNTYAVPSSTISSRAGSVTTIESNVVEDMRPQELYVYEKEIGPPKIKGSGSAGNWAREVYNSIMSAIPTKDYYSSLNSPIPSKNVTQRVVNHQRMKKRRIRIMLRRKNGERQREPKKRGFVRRIYLKVQKPE